MFPLAQYHRRLERSPISMAVTLLIPRPGSDDLVHRALTSDFSNFGARVISSAPLAPGQRLRFIPRDAEQRSLAVPGRVVWVGEPETERAGHAGIEFLIPLEW